MWKYEFDRKTEVKFKLRNFGVLKLLLLDGIKYCFFSTKLSDICTFWIFSRFLPKMTAQTKNSSCIASDVEHGIHQWRRKADRTTWGKEWRHWKGVGHPSASQEIDSKGCWIWMNEWYRCHSVYILPFKSSFTFVQIAIWNIFNQ